MKKLKIDSSHKESLPYLHPSFHVEVCTDVYSEFFHHTLPLHWHDELEFAAVVEATVRFWKSRNRPASFPAATSAKFSGKTTG